MSLAELLRWSSGFTHFDHAAFLLLGVSPETLPGQAPAQKVKQHISASRVFVAAVVREQQASAHRDTGTGYLHEIYLVPHACIRCTLIYQEAGASGMKLKLR